MNSVVRLALPLMTGLFAIGCAPTRPGARFEPKSISGRWTWVNSVCDAVHGRGTFIAGAGDTFTVVLSTSSRYQLMLGDEPVSAGRYTLRTVDSSLVVDIRDTLQDPGAHEEALKHLTVALVLSEQPMSLHLVGPDTLVLSDLKELHNARCVRRLAQPH